MTTTSILLSCFIASLIFCALVPECKTKKTDWREYAKEHEEPFEWEIPEWAYIGTDAEFEESEAYEEEKDIKI